MKRPLKKILSLCCLFLIALACTKDVGLITEVEFQLLEEHSAEGFVNQGLPTTFTIVPEEILENYEYDISYELLQGNGYFEDVEGNRWETGTGKGLPVSSPLTTSLLYMGTETGEHRVKVVGSDNFGISEEIEISYNLKNVPARWEASSALSEIELGKAADISLLFELVNTTLDVTYEARFEYATGSGTLSPSQEGGYSLGGEYAAIVPGTYPLVFTPSELGPQQLVFVLRDSNGQEIKEELAFNVVENIKVISIFLGEDDTIKMQLGDEIAPDITFDPPNATDQGITLVSSDPDVVLIDGNNVCIAVGLGTATVTVTSTANPGASDTVTVTVVEPDRIPVTSIVISQEDPGAQGAVRQLIATVLPDDATDPSVTWSSNDETIATVSATGLLTGLAAGTVTITATSVSDPGVNDTITVEITGGSLQNGSDITAFELPGQNSSVLDPAGHTITVNVTDGTQLNVAPSALGISGGATIEPGIAEVRDFNAPVTYTVTAGNGDEQIWTVNVTVSPLVGSTENDITAFALPGQNDSDIDTANHTVDVSVPDGTALSVVPSTFGISENATVEPALDSQQDFNGPIVYTVTAENGNPQVWTINVTVVANRPPTAVDDATGVELGESVTIDVIANDTDPDTPNSELVIAGVIGVQPANAGSFTQNGREFVFTSSGDYVGDATFGYTVNDGNVGNDDFGQVTVTISRTAVLVTGITLAPNTLSLDIGQNGQLNATVSPDNATNRTLSWSSSDDTVATVSTSGEVTAVSPGPAVITASSNDGSNVETTANINVDTPDVPVSGITVAPSNASIKINGVQQLTATVLPANATDQSITWSSANDAIATVDANGSVTGAGVGTINITATANDGSGVSGTASITITAADVALVGITITQATASILEGATQQLGLVFNPSNATNQDVTWSSNDSNIASVDQNGMVTAIAEGNVIITATSGADNSIFATSSITVAPASIPVTGITISPPSASIEVDATRQFTAQIQPANATDTGVNWISGNTAVARVDSNGMVTGVSEGNTTIIAISAENGTITANATIEVTLPNVPVTGITVTRNRSSIPDNETEQFMAVIAPGNASNPAVTWTSSNTGVARVNASTGMVTAVSEGNTNIIATATGGSGVSGSATLQVTASTISVTGVSVDPTTATIVDGNNTTLIADVSPGNASNTNVTWSSNNNGVATVSNGVVTGESPGTAIITVTTQDGGFTATSTITVQAATVAVTGVSVNPTSATIIKGNTTTLSATVSPNNATNQNVTWSSNNTSVATVSNGTVTGVSAGTATITVTTQDGGFTATSTVTVNAATISVTGVSVNPTTATINEGNTATLNASVQPANATNTNVTWSSSNTAMATVNNGTVTGVSAGTATITVTTVDGGFTATANITVLSPVPVVDDASSSFTTGISRNGSPRTGFQWFRGYNIDLSINFNGLTPTNYIVRIISTGAELYNDDFINPITLTVGPSAAPPVTLALELVISLDNGTNFVYPINSFN